MRAFLLTLVLIALVGGCQTAPKAEQFGKIFYVDGAGNWGAFGSRGLPDGLREAGYKGSLETYIWTVSFNPLIDQLAVGNAKLRGALLSRKIADYIRKYPDNEVNVISLSAGTGVAIWAIEGLPDDAHIHHLFLLGSSVSNDYDIRPALSHIDGKVFVYYSPLDQVLASVEVVGTIDGKRGVKSVGQVGLKVPPGAEGRVVNTGWSREWLDLGWTGAHADTTNKKFVQYELSKYLVHETQHAMNTGQFRGFPQSDNEAVLISSHSR